MKKIDFLRFFIDFKYHITSKSFIALKKVKKMNYTNMNVRDFINHIITYDNVSAILNTGKTQSDKGFIFERLFNIIIKFGFCDIFPNSKFYHLLGNSNTASLKILSDFNSYLAEKVYSGNYSGCSDITLQNKEYETYIFISSKYPRCQTNDIDGKSNVKSKAKSVGYYDIQNIIAMATKNKDIYKNYKRHIPYYFGVFCFFKYTNLQF